MSSREVSLGITSLEVSSYKPTGLYLSTAWLLEMAQGRALSRVGVWRWGPNMTF